MIFAVLVASLIVLVFLFVVKQRRIFKLTENIPGPTPLPFIGNVLELGFTTEQLLKNIQRLAKTYGGIVRLCIGSQINIMLTDPKYIAQVLTPNDSSYKGDLYKIVQPLMGDGLLTSSGEKWVRHRRILSTAFSNKQLTKYVIAFNGAANRLVDQLKELCHLEYVDVGDPVFAYTLYSLCRTVMQVDVKDTTEYHHHADEITNLFFKRYMSPVKMSDFLYRFTKDYRDTKKYAKNIDDFIKNVIKRRMQEYATTDKETTKYSSMLDEMLRLSGDDVLTEEEMRDQVKTFVFAGSDTVGVTLCFAMYELGKRPDIQAKVLEEVECLLGTDINGDINFEDLQDLRYTECVLKEVMRLYAPAIFITRILPSKTYFDDICVPANTVAIINIFGLHKSEKVYPNPDVFDPDRFLPENCKDRHSHSFIPFAAGARICIGQKFAMLEAKLTLAKIIRNFEISPKPGYEPVLIATGTLKTANGFQVKLKPRASIAA